MRLFLAAAAGMLLITTAVGIAQQASTASSAAIDKPAGFDDFFADMEKIMQKYPLASKRFILQDKMSTPLKGKSLICSEGFPCCTAYAEPCCHSGCASIGCCVPIR